MSFWHFLGPLLILGKRAVNPAIATAKNFLWTVPISLAVLLFMPFQLTPQGIGLAVASGALTSGLGYVLWYAVLTRISTSTAAIVQLSVPAIAAIGGVIFLNEGVSSRLIIASLVIFLGIFIKAKN